jgi:hypothetical protein
MDDFGNLMRYQVVEGNPILTSAGPDATFGAGDDIRSDGRLFNNSFGNGDRSQGFLGRCRRCHGTILVLRRGKIKVASRWQAHAGGT